MAREEEVKTQDGDSSEKTATSRTLTVGTWVKMLQCPPLWLWEAAGEWGHPGSRDSRGPAARSRAHLRSSGWSCATKLLPFPVRTGLQAGERHQVYGLVQPAPASLLACTLALRRASSHTGCCCTT